MLRLTAVMLLLFLAGCTYQVPRKYLPYPVSTDSFSDPAKTVAIPLPVIASSPNEGITVGGLVAFLLHNARDEVGSLVVPQMNYNRYFGVTTTLYGAFYPTPEQKIRINLSQASNINKEYRIRYYNDSFFSDRYDVYVNAFNFTDGSARFFGFQSKSAKQNETNYSYDELGITLSGGYHLSPRFELVLGERIKRVDIGRGAVKTVPFITDVFVPDTVPGVGGYTVHGQKISLVYSSLDSADLPSTGNYGRISFENSAKIIGSSSDFRGFELEAKKYIPKKEGRFISVIRFSASQIEGKRVPFLEQSILGGENTLRGYGLNRFIDKSYILLNLEERIRLFRWKIFNVTADWEAAPFIDLGSVMRSLVEAKASTFEFNPGIGLRTVVRPNIVGRIDVGIGREGPAVFVGLGYPF